MKLTVVNHVSLDGVMQAPASPDEDPSGGFEHGGWAVPYGDADVLNRTQKYVASTTLSEPLPWENSTLLAGDRLFQDDGTYAQLRLVDTVTTTTGVIIATYRR